MITFFNIVFQEEDLTTNKVVNVFDMTKDASGTAEDHGFIRFSYDVDACTVNVSNDEKGR